MPNRGFGICGHKNAYSSGTLCGNWVEDARGAQAVHASSGSGDDMVSESMSNYCTPEVTATKSDVKNTAEGLSHDLLISHTGHDEKAKYTTSYTAATGKARRDGELERQRRKRQDKAFHTSPYTTELSRSSASPFAPQAMAKNTR